MKSYLAINIGPIFKTFSLARKPKEFWAASYLFSCLMECILKYLAEKGSRLMLISPCYDGTDYNSGVGLFPDRAFYELDESERPEMINSLVDEGVSYFAREVGLKESVAKDYFRIMTVYGEYRTSAEAISKLNTVLNGMELNQIAWSSYVGNSMLEYLQKANTNSPLFEKAFDKSYYKTDTLESIARATASEPQYSYQKYVCVVRADGDNMGKVVSSPEMEGKLEGAKGFSSKLMAFGREASRIITEFKGFPIYAGGDDLLFIAPVRCSRGNIFDLINQIDAAYAIISDAVREYGCGIGTTISYGISVIYNKYPLYEAWKVANDMLHDAKKGNKNKVAMELRKHSGSYFRMLLNKNTDIYGDFTRLLGLCVNDSVVSSLAHKMRANEHLFNLLPKEPPFDNLSDRIGAFYRIIMDEDTKSEDKLQYLDYTKALFENLYKNYFCHAASGPLYSCSNGVNSVISEFYSMLRIAKFIAGEDLKNE